MTIKFRDTSEYKKVEGAKKATRPSYYNADIQANIEISEDFEAALVLLPSSVREQARKRLDAQTPATDRMQKRNGILKAALQVEIENAAAQDDELQNSMTDLQEFKSKFSEYAEVGEVGLLLRDAQIDMDEMIMASDRAKHRLVCASILSSRIETDGISPDLDKERKSWLNVLIAYSGV
jgi:hypothetical protein